MREGGEDVRVLDEVALGPKRKGVLPLVLLLASGFLEILQSKSESETEL